MPRPAGSEEPERRYRSVTADEDAQRCFAVVATECTVIPDGGLRWIERTDGDVISVRIAERKFRRSSVGIDVWLFFQPADERARPCQSYVEVVDPEEQEEAVARLGVVGTFQRGMLVGTPLVQAEQ